MRFGRSRIGMPVQCLLKRRREVLRQTQMMGRQEKTKEQELEQQQRWLVAGLVWPKPPRRFLGEPMMKLVLVLVLVLALVREPIFSHVWLELYSPTAPNYYLL